MASNELGKSPLYLMLPANLYSRLVTAAKQTDLKLVSIVKQALEKWLDDRGM